MQLSILCSNFLFCATRYFVRFLPIGALTLYCLSSFIICVAAIGQSTLFSHARALPYDISPNGNLQRNML